ncbi:MAG: hypothetical protein ACOY45_10700 [Pseudomonadota bacterium]
MADVVIVAYRPKPGCEEALLALARAHVPRLQALGLATDRAPVLMRGEGGVVIEVFEWADGGIDRAHGLPEVQAMWQRYAEVCDYVPLASVAEAGNLFAEFEPVAL